MKNKKSLGQNWLKDRPTLEAIADFASDLPNSLTENSLPLCVEIGPGLGTLTSSLLRRFDKVLAIEFDKNLADNLPKSFPGKKLIVKNEDILTFDFSQIIGPFVVVGNIPYYITSPIIKKLLTLPQKPQKIVLLVQKEVAEKIVSSKHSSFSLFVDNYAKSSLGPVVKRIFFTPPPKVDSQVILFEPYRTPKFPPELLSFIHQCFSNPRKKLITNLSVFSSHSKTELKEILDNLKINIDARPSDLNLENYTMLAKALEKR